MTASHVPPRRAVVIGGSIGGLFAAHLLRQRGWDVTVHERAAQTPAGRGAGIVTHPELWAALQAAGVGGRASLGVEVAERVTLARDGGVLGTLPCPQILTSWDRVFGLLRDPWPDDRYRLGQELRAVEPRDSGVVAHFADGSRVEAALLVAADGVRSAVRQQLLPHVAPLYAGYVAWRGLVSEADIPAFAHAALFHRFGFCLPDREQMLGYPVAGEGHDLRPGHRRYNFVWYRPADEAAALPRLLTDASGITHTQSIPPPLIHPEIIAAMRADADRLLAPAFAALVAATRTPFLQPIYDLEVPRMVFGRVALLGDAAFVARPHVGAGVTKAAEDALALADAVEAGVRTGLVAYETARLRAGQRFVQRARHLGAYMQAVLKSDDERAAAERHHTPEAVMAETALLAF